MKKLIILTLFSAVFLSFAVKATVYTVSNNNNSPGQFLTIQAAHDAAADGDTLYIHASPKLYGDVTIQKRLTLIGEGALPNKQIQFSSQVSAIRLTYAPLPPVTTASGSKFFGLDISSLTVGSINSSYVYNIDNLTISRNRIGNLSYSVSCSEGSTNNMITNNIIQSVNSKLRNSLFSNNIVYTINETFTGSNNIFINNIIQYSIAVKGALVSNNIFYNFSSNGKINTASCTETVFNNNLFYSFTPVTIGDIVYGSNTGTGNLLQQDPKFVTPTLSETLRGYDYDKPVTGPFADYHLQNTSPGKNYGTDGKDIGIYGGGYPWVDGSTSDSRFRYYAMPYNVPHMKSMDILNTVQPLNGTLNVQFNAETQN